MTPFAGALSGVGFYSGPPKAEGFPAGSDLRWPNFSQILGVASKFAKRHVIQACLVLQRLSPQKCLALI